MPGDFGELTVNISLGINFLAGGTFYFNSNDTLSYITYIISSLLSPPEITCTMLRQCFHKNIDQIYEIAIAFAELERFFK